MLFDSLFVVMVVAFNLRHIFMFIYFYWFHKHFKIYIFPEQNKNTSVLSDSFWSLPSSTQIHTLYDYFLVFYFSIVMDIIFFFSEL